jgi:PPOX class probable F420-dependent enzyme
VLALAERMTRSEYYSFLRDRARTAVLATVRADGRPHAAPVWFDLDGDTFVFTTGQDTVKGRNLGRDPRVALCIDDENPPFHFIIVEGTAKLTSEDPDLLQWSTRIGGRYMGAERANEYGQRNAVPSELLVRVTPHKILAHKNISE